MAVAARAQQAGRSRASLLAGRRLRAIPSPAQRAAFRDALRRLGWIDGRNLQIEVRWGDAAFTRRTRAKPPPN